MKLRSVVTAFFCCALATFALGDELLEFQHFHNGFDIIRSGYADETEAPFSEDSEQQRQLLGNSEADDSGLGRRVQGQGQGSNRARRDVLSISDISIVVGTHNSLRRNVGASNMGEMRWNSLLAELATNYSELCTFNHGQVPYNTALLPWANVGQNLAANVDMDWASVINQWYDEKQYFNYDDLSCATSQMCGHYTQVAWAETTAVGCGVTVCPSLSVPGQEDLQGYQLFVCNYGPAGNIVGEQPYLLGLPCSQCDTATSCDNGLCSMASNSDYPTATSDVISNVISTTDVISNVTSTSDVTSNVTSTSGMTSNVTVSDATSFNTDVTSDTSSTILNDPSSSDVTSNDSTNNNSITSESFSTSISDPTLTDITSNNPSTTTAGFTYIILADEFTGASDQPVEGTTVAESTTVSVSTRESNTAAAEITTAAPSTGENSTSLTTQSSAENRTGLTTASGAENTTGLTTRSPTENTTGITTQSSVENTTGLTTQSSVENTTGLTTQSPAENTTGITTRSPTENTTGLTTQSPAENTTGLTTRSSAENTTGLTTQPAENATGLTTAFSAENTTGLTTVSSANTTEITTQSSVDNTTTPLINNANVTSSNNVTSANETTTHLINTSTNESTTANFSTTSVPNNLTSEGETTTTAASNASATTGSFQRPQSGLGGPLNAGTAPATNQSTNVEQNTTLVTTSSSITDNSSTVNNASIASTASPANWTTEAGFFTTTSPGLNSTKEASTNQTTATANTTLSSMQTLLVSATSVTPLTTVTATSSAPTSTTTKVAASSTTLGSTTTPRTVFTTTFAQQGAKCAAWQCQFGGTAMQLSSGACYCQCYDQYQGNQCQYSRSEARIGVLLKITAPLDVWYGKAWPLVSPAIVKTINDYCNSHVYKCCPGTSQNLPYSAQYVQFIDRDSVHSGQGYPTQTTIAGRLTTVVLVYASPSNLPSSGCNAVTSTGGRNRRDVTNVVATTIDQDVLFSSLQQIEANLSKALQSCCNATLTVIRADPYPVNSRFPMWAVCVIATVAIVVVTGVAFYCYWFLSRSKARCYREPLSLRGARMLDDDYRPVEMLPMPAASSSHSQPPPQ